MRRIGLVRLAQNSQWRLKQNQADLGDRIAEEIMQPVITKGRRARTSFPVRSYY